MANQIAQRTFTASHSSDKNVLSTGPQVWSSQPAILQPFLFGSWSVFNYPSLSGLVMVSWNMWGWIIGGPCSQTTARLSAAQHNTAKCSTIQHNAKHPNKVKPKIASSAQHVCTPQHRTQQPRFDTLCYAYHVTHSMNSRSLDELQSYSDIEATLSSDNSSERDLWPVTEPLNFDHHLFLAL